MKLIYAGLLYDTDKSTVIRESKGVCRGYVKYDDSLRKTPNGRWFIYSTNSTGFELIEPLTEEEAKNNLASDIDLYRANFPLEDA